MPGVPIRRKGTTVTDAKTFELTETLAKGLENLLGRKPYIVAANFDRKYIDANRAESAAFEDPRAKPVYDAYHTHIRQFVDELRRQYPNGALLLDIHGQSQDPATVHRGTRDSLTVERLVKNHGMAALVGSNSIFGRLQARGYTVYPPNTPLGNPPEDRRFNGGYIVAAYGSNNQDGIDAIQLEIGILLREDWTFAKALVEAIGIFYKYYLVRTEKELRSTPAIRKDEHLTSRFRPIAISDG
jgi:N-formylglutamate amidohydrolase